MSSATWVCERVETFGSAALFGEGTESLALVSATASESAVASISDRAARLRIRPGLGASAAWGC
jgi:hypothetical protein